MLRTLTPEVEALTHLARIELAACHRKAIVHLLDQGLDQNLLCDLATWHRLAPLVAKHVASMEGLGTAVVRLTPVVEASILRARRQRWELHKLLLAFESEEIDVILLKGAALVATVYPMSELRPMGDLDLLVAWEDLEAAIIVARHLGYAERGSESAQREAMRNHRHAPAMWNRTGTVCLELHHHLVRPSSTLAFDLRGLWRRTRSLELEGQNIRVLAPEDQVIHLALAAFLDLRQRYPSSAALGRLTDVSEVLLHNGETFDWERLARTTSGLPLAGPLGCILRLTEELLGTAPPDQLRATLTLDRYQRRWIDSLVEYRVLRSPHHPWHFHELVEPPDPATLGRQLMSLRHTLFPSRLELERCYGLTDPWQARCQHLQATAGLLLQPSRVAHELALDRWLNGVMTDAQAVSR